MASPRSSADELDPVAVGSIRTPATEPRTAMQVAPVDLFAVMTEKAERMGAPGPFGYWVSFVPRSARHAEFEIVAHGQDGGEIGCYEYRSDVTN